MDKEISKSISVYDNSFDYLRLYVALLVFYGHACTHLELAGIPYFNLFRLTVPVFFMLSGFWAVRSYEKSKSVGNYYKKRLTRIYPELLLLIVVNFLIITLGFGFRPGFIDSVIYFFTQTFAMNFYTGAWLRPYGVGAPNGSLWTIPVTIQFYLFMPLIWKIIKKTDFKKDIVLFVSAILMGIIGNVGFDYVFGAESIITKLFHQTLVGYLYIFLIGIYFFKYFDVFKAFLSFRFSWLIIPIYTLLMFIDFSGISKYLGAYNFVVIILQSFFVFWIGYRLGKHRIKYEISYEIYLVHMIFINILVELGYMGSYGILLLSLALTIITSFLLHYVNSKIVKRL